MRKLQYFLMITFLIIFSRCINTSKKSDDEPIRAYNIDFNWGEGGPNGFAKPGLWADANPAEHINWYADLGCNVIQSFAVSCNGYAWYKNGIIPEQPGLKYDFLTEQVKLAHKKNIKVFGYFCAGSNTKWGLEHPDLSYGIPSSPHIPYTAIYLDYLCASIEDAIRKTDMDGVFIDWLWNPGTTMEPYPPVRWLECEQLMFNELMNQPFPGKDKIKETVKKTKPGCIIWLTSCQLTSKDIAGSDMLKEVDWVLNEAGDIITTESVRSMLGPQTRLVTCLANWNKQDAAKVIPAAIKENIGLYGFTKPVSGSMMKPANYYLSKSIDSLKADERNIGALVRTYNNLPLNYVKR
jgi:hypothetical protein